jgi:putative transposase
MTYNPETHHRQSIRLRGYDYSQTGAYFVTVCAWKKECLFGEIKNGEMLLNEYGRCVREHWDAIAGHFDNVGVQPL